MPLTIDQYRQYVLERKFTQNPSFYTMDIPGGGIKNDRFLRCYPDSIILPGRTFLTAPFSYFGPEYDIPLRREYNQLSVNFLVFQDWKERQFFDNWMDSVLPYNTPSRSVASVSDIFPKNLEDVVRNIAITFNARKTTSGSNAINQYYNFIDAYPTLITPTAFSADNSGYTVFTVNFSYRYYESNQQAVDLPTKGL